jgi:hypothetical protein
MKETSVMRSIPSGMPSDDWPCFVLTDAVVYHRDGRTMANPLHADLEGPFMVRGKLEVEDREQQTYRGCTLVPDNFHL